MWERGFEPPEALRHGILSPAHLTVLWHPHSVRERRFELLCSALWHEALDLAPSAWLGYSRAYAPTLGNARDRNRTCNLAWRRRFSGPFSTPHCPHGQRRRQESNLIRRNGRTLLSKQGHYRSVTTALEEDWSIHCHSSELDSKLSNDRRELLT